MSDGNKLAAIAYAQHRQQNILPFEQMGNVLLEVMQGTLVCLDSRHIIMDVSQTVKRYFGFEQTELVGLSILLIIEDSERDLFLKFLNSTQLANNMCCVRMMMNNTNEYRQVKVHRKKKFNQDNVDVHSTTPRHSYAIGTILIVTLEESSYIDITLHDIHKQEFYTKMNLLGEITFEDHRGALITGFLPHEIVRKSIFNFVHQKDCLVKLHALWKCVTTGASKLQWRLNARDGSIVFLQTEYKLIANSSTYETIIARNEVLTPVQRSQFDELQTAWRHQCTADIKGNSSSFKLISPSDSDLSSVNNGECRICVPSLNMCFTTNKLQPLSLIGNIFDGTKLARPLTIQDYIHILIDNNQFVDSELACIINNIQSLTARYRRLNETDKSQTDTSDNTTDDKCQSESLSPSTDSALRRKQDSDSIVRGILNNSMHHNQQKQTDESPSTLIRLLNGNANHGPPQSGSTRSSSLTPTFTYQPTEFPTNQTKSNVTSPNAEFMHQQHIDFIKKYNAAKTKLESQLEMLRTQEVLDGGQIIDVTKRNTILNKLSQLETIKNKHLARRRDLKRHTTTPTVTPVHNGEQKNFLTNLFSSASSGSTSGFLSMTTNGTNTSIPSPIFSLSNDHLSSSFYPSNYQQFDSHSQIETSNVDDFLTPPPSSSVHSYMNASFHDTIDDSTIQSSFLTNHQHQHYHHHST